jgi:hypothetical protein
MLLKLKKDKSSKAAYSRSPEGNGPVMFGSPGKLYEALALTVSAQNDKPKMRVIIADDMAIPYQTDTLFRIGEKELDDFDIIEHTLPKGWRLYRQFKNFTVFSYPQLWSVETIEEFCKLESVKFSSDLQRVIQKTFVDDEFI